MRRVLTRSAASSAIVVVAESVDDAEATPAKRAPSPEEVRAERLRGIVRAHFAAAWKFLRRVGFAEDVVDDATQELFLLVRRRIDDVVPGAERAFLFKAAYRIATHIRRKRVRELPSGHLGLEGERIEPRPEERLDDARARALLYELLGELDENHRVVFVMFEIEQMTMQEIADTLDIPLGTVASRLRRGRADFRARLARNRMRTTDRRGT